MRPHALLAYNAAGEIVATIDHMVALDGEGNPLGLCDFAAHEAAGGKLRDFWEVPSAIGSGTWPEWLPTEHLPHFRVELDHSQPHRIRRLVHKSGHVRHRDRLEQEIARREDAEVADLRDLVGGPMRPLRLDERGRTVKGQRDSERPMSGPFGGA